jgi:chloramphenicol 3-O-phosphotransferase
MSERLDTLLAEIPIEREFVTESDCKRTLFAVTVIPMPLVGVMVTDELVPRRVTDLFTDTDSL